MMSTVVAHVLLGLWMLVVLILSILVLATSLDKEIK